MATYTQRYLERCSEAYAPKPERRMAIYKCNKDTERYIIIKGAPVTLTQQRLQQATPPKTDRNLLTLP
jgi:hypothetical protein